MTLKGWSDFIVWQCSLRQRNYRMSNGKPSEGIIALILDNKSNKEIASLRSILIEKKRNPGKPIYVNMYKESHKVKNAKKLPESLEKSLKHLNDNQILKSAFGKDVIDSYIKLKNREIKKYNSSMVKKLGFRGTKKSNKANIITQWEKDNTLDC